jgi:ubiquitin-protein ligase
MLFKKKAKHLKTILLKYPNVNSMVLSKKAISRIRRDLKVLTDTPLVMENIFLLPDEEDMRIVRALIIGPDDVPYQDGFYFYKFVFPNNYPYSPPKATYYTNDGQTRMHPNFYTCGKVCVSILGTWSGPGWTSSQSISSVILTIRSLMIKHPLWQEPGYQGKKDTQNKNYNTLITYENMRIGIQNMLNSTPRGFEGFLPIMRQHFLDSFPRLQKKCEKLRQYEGTIIEAPKIFRFKKKMEVKKLEENLATTRSQIQLLLEQARPQYQKIWDWVGEKVPIEGISYRDLEKEYYKQHQSEEDDTKDTDKIDKDDKIDKEASDMASLPIAVWLQQKKGEITRNHEGTIFLKA